MHTRILFLLVLAAGCTPEFDNFTTVKDLRLLAINADPPEILIDLQEAMANPAALLAALQPVKVTPLVVDPNGGGRSVEYRVQACENRPEDMPRGSDNGPGRVQDTISQAPCPEGSTPVAEGSAVAGPDGSVPMEVMFQPTPELLVNGVRADPLSLELGLPITLSFTVRAGDEQVVALKRVLFTPRIDPSQRPNQNPQITQMTVRNSKTDPPLLLDAEAPPAVPLSGKLRLAPSPAQAESYRARAFSRSERQFITEEVPEETLRYTFYTTQGTFSPGAISTRPSPLLTDPVIELETTYEAPAALGTDGKTDVFLFVVVRDERGGSSFVRGRLALAGPELAREPGYHNNRLVD
jgi:hypothetical protein